MKQNPSKPISFVHYVQYLMKPRRICFVLPIVGAICLLVWRQQFDLLASSSSLLLSANVTKQETAAALPVVPRRRILVLVSDYKPPSERLTDLLVHYQTSFVDHQNNSSNNLEFDFYFLCTDNFRFYPGRTKDTPSCEAAASNTPGPIPYLVLQPDIAQPILNQCTYCLRNLENPWGWAAYMAPLLALRQLQAQKRNNQYYDAVWSSDPDNEFLGDNVWQWFSTMEHELLQQQSSSLQQPIPIPLLSSLVLPSVEQAQQLLLQPGMYARIQSTWRWDQAPHGHSIPFGVFTYLTRFTTDMLQAVQDHLTESSTFVETYLPYVCTQAFGRHNSTCPAASLYYHDVGFFNNAGNVFAGEELAQPVRDLQSLYYYHDKWYHPLKFNESWRTLSATTTTMDEELVDADGHYKESGKCVTMNCAIPLCDSDIRDDCIFVRR